MARSRKYSSQVRERAVRMVRQHGPVTLTWVDWFNTRWLMDPIRCEHRGQ
jgi:hypothetical protein